jgi:hypothetical protein
VCAWYITSGGAARRRPSAHTRKTNKANKLTFGGQGVCANPLANRPVSPPCRETVYNFLLAVIFKFFIFVFDKILGGYRQVIQKLFLFKIIKSSRILFNLLFLRLPKHQGK